MFSFFLWNAIENSWARKLSFWKSKFIEIALGLSSSPRLASNTRGVKEAVKHEAFTAAFYSFLIFFLLQTFEKVCDRKRKTFKGEKENRRGPANLFRASTESPT